jgi:hypothetical protein
LDRLAEDSKLGTESTYCHKFGDNKLTFALHLIENEHNMGKMEGIIKVVYEKKKSRHHAEILHI